MKHRIIALLIAVSLTLCLSACGTRSDRSDRSELIGGSGGSGTSEESNGSEEYGGVGDGRIGDVIETYFYDFTVNSAYVDTEYYGYTPQSGNQLLIADVTVKNTTNQTIPMADTDFQAQWGEDGDDDYSIPITTDFDTWELNEAGLVNPDEQFPYEYELKIGESRTGVLVFEVPLGYRDFSISTGDFFSDGEVGDYYFVYFTAE